MRITLETGDITAQRVDAVVNAANSSLLGGGGVDGAIHRRGGPEILAACRELRASPLREGLPTGQAVATTAGGLPARWVIHTVGPVYSAERGPLACSPPATGNRCGSPTSSGAGRWRSRRSRRASTGGRAGRRADRAGHRGPGIARVGETRFVLFTPDMHAIFARVDARD